MAKTGDLIQGTLDLLILTTLAREAAHGWGIAQRIHEKSAEALQVQQGSLYPALHRLEQQGWIAAEWGEAENNRKVRVYRLTREGRRALAKETETWDRLSRGVNLVVRSAEA